MSDVIRTANPEAVIDLQGLAEANAAQERAEKIQRRILSAQLASQVLSGNRNLPGQVDALWADLALTIDNFIRVD